MRIDFEHFHKALLRIVETSSAEGITLKDILIEYRDDLGTPVAYFFGEKDGKEMQGAAMLRASTA